MEYGPQAATDKRPGITGRVERIASLAESISVDLHGIFSRLNQSVDAEKLAGVPSAPRSTHLVSILDRAEQDLSAARKIIENIGAAI